MLRIESAQNSFERGELRLVNRQSTSKDLFLELNAANLRSILLNNNSYRHARFDILFSTGNARFSWLLRLTFPVDSSFEAKIAYLYKNQKECL